MNTDFGENRNVESGKRTLKSGEKPARTPALRRKTEKATD
jgi:hypothetical protein